MQTTVECRRLFHRLLLDLLLFLVLTLPICICEFLLEPVRRGFFCDDDSIRYPYRSNTFSTTALVLLVALPAPFIFALVEWVREQRTGALDMRQLTPLPSLPRWLQLAGRQFAYYAVGAVLTFDATELGKFAGGRLRPHFMAVCQPQLIDGSSCEEASNRHRYIEQYFCSDTTKFTADDVQQARLSFPSGHSSMSVYAMVYLTLYLQRQLTWRGSRLTRHTLQFILLMLAWIVALSRLRDYWHHWSDVLAGSFIGLIGALLTACYMSKLFKRRHTSLLGAGGSSSIYGDSSALDGSRLTLQLKAQQHHLQMPQTPQSPQEALSQVNVQHENGLMAPRARAQSSVTPPPYSLNSLNTLDSLRSGNNEQFCTKV